MEPPMVVSEALSPNHITTLTDDKITTNKSNTITTNGTIPNMIVTSSSLTDAIKPNTIEDSSYKDPPNHVDNKLVPPPITIEQNRIAPPTSTTNNALENNNNSNMMNDDSELTPFITKSDNDTTPQRTQHNDDSPEIIGMMGSDDDDEQEIDTSLANFQEEYDPHVVELEAPPEFVPRPPDGGWGWIIVFASFFCNMVVDGICYTVGVLYMDLEKSFPDSPASKMAWIGSLLSGMYLCVGPIVSAMTNKFGCRPVTIAGGIISSFAFLIAMFSPSINMLILTYGVLGGIGFGLIYLPAIVSVGYYFERKRAFATGIAVCGSGVGTFVFGPMTKFLIDRYGWRGSLAIFSGIILNTVVMGALMRPLPMPKAPKAKPLLQRIKEDKDARMRIASDPKLYRIAEDPLIEEGAGTKQTATIEEGTEREVQQNTQHHHHDDRLNSMSLSNLTRTRSRLRIPASVVMATAAEAEATSSTARTEITGGPPINPILSSTASGIDAQDYRHNIEQSLRLSISHHHKNRKEGGPDFRGSRISLPVGRLSAATYSPSSLVVSGGPSSSRSRNVSATDQPSRRRATHTAAVALSPISTATSVGSDEQPVAATADFYHDDYADDNDADYENRERLEEGDTLSPLEEEESATTVGGMNQGVELEFTDPLPVPEDFSRPLYKKDIFYSGSVVNLPEYRGLGDSKSYYASMVSIPVGVAASNLGPAADTRFPGREPSIAPSISGQFGPAQPPPASKHRFRQFLTRKLCPCLGRRCADPLSEMTDLSLFREPVFLLVCLSNVLAFAGFYVPFVYSVALAKQIGVVGNQASLLVSIIGASNIVGRLFFGYLTDNPRVDSLLVNNVCMVIVGACTIICPLCKSFGLLAFNLLIFGLSVAAFISLTSIILVDLMGIDRLTNAFGLLILFRGITSIVGPPLAGWIYDKTGNYNASFYVSGSFIVAAGLVSFMLKPVQKRSLANKFRRMTRAASNAFFRKSRKAARSPAKFSTVGTTGADGYVPMISEREEEGGETGTKRMNMELIRRPLHHRSTQMLRAGSTLSIIASTSPNLSGGGPYKSVVGGGLGSNTNTMGSLQVGPPGAPRVSIIINAPNASASSPDSLQHKGTTRKRRGPHRSKAGQKLLNKFHQHHHKENPK